MRWTVEIKCLICTKLDRLLPKQPSTAVSLSDLSIRYREQARGIGLRNLLLSSNWYPNSYIGIYLFTNTVFMKIIYNNSIIIFFFRMIITFLLLSFNWYRNSYIFYLLIWSLKPRTEQNEILSTRLRSY